MPDDLGQSEANEPRCGFKHGDPLPEDGLTEEEARNGALCLIALDACLCDGMTPERAIEFARGIEKAVNEEPYWANGKHAGDCTKQPMTCGRCVIEDAEREARRRYEED